MAYPTKFIALDLELNQPSSRIIQVGVAIGSPMQSEEEWVVHQWLLDPQEPIACVITNLTGITDEDIRTQAVSWPALAASLGALIDQHAPFVNPVTWGGGDTVELLSAFRARGIRFPYFGRRWIDVKTIQSFLRLARRKNLAGGLTSALTENKLQFVGEQHRAHHDAFNTLRLFFRLLERQGNFEAIRMLARG